MPVLLMPVGMPVCQCSVPKTSSRHPFIASARTSPHPCKIASKPPSKPLLPPQGATMHPNGQNKQSGEYRLTSLALFHALLVQLAGAIASERGLVMAW